MKQILMSAVAAAALVASPAFAQQGNMGFGLQACPPGQDCPQGPKHKQRNGPSANGGGQMQMQGGGQGGPGMRMQGNAGAETAPMGPTGKKRLQMQGNGQGQMQPNTAETGNAPMFPKKKGHEQAQNPPRQQNEMSAEAGGHMSKQQAFRRMHVSPAPRITFNVSVGAPIPRAHRPHLYPLPPYFLAFYPHYRHYEYFMTPDGYIVVVNPHNWRIVAVIPA